MKLSEKLKKFIIEVVREESEDLKNREILLEENVRYLNATVAGYETVAENVRNLNVTVAGYEAVAENVRNLNAAIKGQEAVAENVRNLNDMLEDYEEVVHNSNNINSRMEILSSIIEMQKVKLAMLEKANNTQHSCSSASDSSVSRTEQKTLPLLENVYEGIDYFDFENHFRGTRDQIKRNQQQYIKYYEGRKNVIDLGCGRGEFLELLKENDIQARGVDLYEEFTMMCQMHGLDIVCDDALHFLSEQQKTGGIFAGQLIEHLSVNQLVELCSIA